MKTYTQLRDRAFIDSCRREIKALPPGQPIDMRLITRRAAANPPGGYFIDYDYALRGLRRHRRSKPATSRPFWSELSAKVANLEQRHSISDSDALSRVLQTDTPSSFYLTDSYALRLYHIIHRRNRPRRPLPARHP